MNTENEIRRAARRAMKTIDDVYWKMMREEDARKKGLLYHKAQAGEFLPWLLTFPPIVGRTEGASKHAGPRSLGGNLP